MLTEADRQAVDALTAVEPAWTGMRTAADALGLETRTLLHCGPPATPAHALVPPILNSAAVACVFEGWADDLDEASTLVCSGSIRFLPAQDHRTATPMAAVVSPSMRMIEMSDLENDARRCYAPINGGGHGGSPVPRYGRRAPQCVTFLRFLNGPVADLLDEACSEPLRWLPLIDHALTGGDDTHLRHVAAHAHLLQVIDARRRGPRTDAEADAFIREWPIFHLNFWMAAVRCILDGAAGVPSSSLVTALGGNGKHSAFRSAVCRGAGSPPKQRRQSADCETDSSPRTPPARSATAQSSKHSASAPSPTATHHKCVSCSPDTATTTSSRYRRASFPPRTRDCPNPALSPD